MNVSAIASGTEPRAGTFTRHGQHTCASDARLGYVPCLLATSLKVKGSLAIVSGKNQ